MIFESTTLFLELRWYLEYFEDGPLIPEIDDNLIHFYDSNGKKIVEWTATEANGFRKTVLNNFDNITTLDTVKPELIEFFAPVASKVSNHALYYATATNKRFPLGEPAIATNFKDSYHYAVNVLKKRFPLGEPIIATNALWSFQYARDVCKGKFLLGEKIIATNAAWSFQYAQLIKKRFLLGEPVINAHPSWSVNYQKLFR